MKQIFTKAIDMEYDKTKRQADLDLFGKLVSGFGEFRRKGS